MATATIYSSSGDGYIRNHGNFTWAQLQGGGSGTKSADSTAATAVNFAYNDGTSADKYIDRGFFAFDLSSIPTNATISAVSLNIWVTSKDSGAGGALGVTAASQASTSSLSTSDFTAVTSTEYVTRVNFASLGTGAYQSFAFNSTGKTDVATAVAAAGYFKCSTRGSFDIDNSAPGTTVWSGAYGYYSERTGTSNDPYLSITYSTPLVDTWAWSDTVSMARGGHTVLVQTVTSAVGDGHVDASGTTSFAATRALTSGTATYTESSAAALVEASGNGVHGAGDRTIKRAFLPFDTAFLDDSDPINSAQLKVWINSVSESGATGSLCLVSGSQASNTSLTANDFDNVGSTDLATRVLLSGVSTPGYATFTLNATGIAAINRSGFTQFALRNSYDLDGTDPGSSNYSACSGSYGEDVAAHRPTLLVTTGTGQFAGNSSDSWAWSDASAPYWRSRSQPVLIRAAGANTTLSASTASTAGTMPVVSTASFPATGTFGIADLLNPPTYPERVFTYTSKDSTHFYGCTETTGLGSYTFPSGAGVGAMDAENNFASITPMDTTTTPPLLATYRQLFWDGAVHNAKIMAKKSLDGGLTWSSESQIITPYQSNHGFGLQTVLRCADGSYFAAWGEWVHDYSSPRALSVYSSRCAAGSDPTLSASWDTPVAVNSVFSKDDMSIGTGILEYAGAIYLTVYGLDTGSSWADDPNTQYSKLIKTTDKGATTGNWSLVGTIATLAQCNNRASAENSLTVLDNGDWISHMRVETNVPLGYTTLDHYQARSTDHGVTWSGHTNITPSVGNTGVSHQMPEGHIVSQGQDLLHGGQTITYISVDGAVTWPSTYYRQEPQDATYSIGKGSDFAYVPGTNGAQPQTVNVFSQENSVLTGSQIKFQWYAIPNFPFAVDTWAWSDSAAGRITVHSKATSDAWAWSDSVATARSFSRTGYNFTIGRDYEVWLWVDTVATFGASSISRTTSDAWAWADTATQTTTHSRTTSDTWVWADAGALPSANFYSRTTSDTWVWTDTSGTNPATIYWLRARRSSMSAPTKTYVQAQAKGTARTATWTTPTYKAETEAGILVVLDVTAASGTGGLTLRINAHDQASSQAVPLNAAPTAVTGTGTTSYVLYPFGAVAGNVTQATSFYLPRMFSITVTHGDSSSYTYSVGYCLLP